MSGTPFIPPLNTPEVSPISSPVIPSTRGSPNTAPAGWPTATSASNLPAGYPMFSPYQNVSPFVPTSPYVSPGVIPGQPHSRNNSRQEGLSADWTGYPQGTPFTSPNAPLPGAHTSPNSLYGQPPPLVPGAHPSPNSLYGQPPLVPGSHPNSPWYSPSASAPYPAFGGTPWPAPSQQLPQNPAQWGVPPRNPPPQAPVYTPWAPPPTLLPPTNIPPPPAAAPAGWGAPPQQAFYQPPDPNPWGGLQFGHPGHAGPGPRGPQPSSQAFDKLDPFVEGDSYGPVIDPKLIRIVGALVRINPLIAPVPDEGPEPVYLRWNMLYPTSTIQRSTDPSHISWSKGREAPATFPRLKELRIVSETLPWIIHVKASREDIGITCAEVIDAIARDLYRNTGKEDFDSLPSGVRHEVRTAYKYNRSPLPTVPGGMLGQGLKRLDFLRKTTIFDGIEVNDRAVKKVFGDIMPGVFVLKCSHNMMTKKEVEDQQKRMGHSRPSSKGRSRSRAGSMNVSIVPPTETSSDEGDVDR